VVERIAAEPFASFAERFAAAARRGGHDLVFVSQIFFNSAGACGSLDAIAAAVRDPQTLVVFDGYHGFMALPTALAGNAGRPLYFRRRVQNSEAGGGRR